MFYWRSEGELIKNGLNVYPLNNTESAGVVLNYKDWYLELDIVRQLKNGFVIHTS